MAQNTQIRILGIPVWEKRANDPVPTGTIASPDSKFVGVFGFGTDSGINVSEELALTLSAVWSAVKILGETLAMMPLNVYSVNEKGDRFVDRNNGLQRLLHRKPNQMMTSFVFRETMQLHLNLTGNAYAFINRDAYNNVLSLDVIESPREVIPFKFNGEKFFYYRGRTFLNNEILHIYGMGFDGLKGKNPIQYQREQLGTGISIQKFGASFFKNGVRNSGVLEVPGKLTTESYNNLSTSFSDRYAGTANVGKVPILEGGAKFTPISLTNEDAQYLGSRKFSVNEIARMFRVPPHMLADLESSTNNNIEHQGIEFATYTMTPHCVRWEQEMNDKLIPVGDQDRKYVKFNMDVLLRGDAASRTAMYKDLVYVGALSPNEIRAKEELNAYEGGDKKFIQVNMMPVEMAGKNIQTKVEGNK
jgi:HK97 family phage portal protein